MSKKYASEKEELDELLHEDAPLKEELHRIAVLKGEDPVEAAKNLKLKYKVKKNGEFKLKRRIARTFKEVWNRPFYMEGCLFNILFQPICAIPLLGYIPALILALTEYLVRKILSIFIRF